MTLDELRTHLLALTPEEKAEAVQLLVHSLGDVWFGIEKKHRESLGEMPALPAPEFRFGIWCNIVVWGPRMPKFWRLTHSSLR